MVFDGAATVDAARGEFQLSAALNGERRAARDGQGAPVDVQHTTVGGSARAGQRDAASALDVDQAAVDRERRAALYVERAAVGDRQRSSRLDDDRGRTADR